MSAEALGDLLDRMTAWVEDPAWEPEASALARWNEAFHAARNGAEGAGIWAIHADRARRLAGRLEERRRAVEALRDAVRHRLDASERGARALRAYAPDEAAAPSLRSDTTW